MIMSDGKLGRWLDKMVKIVIFNGPPSSGKDTFADILGQRLGAVRAEFKAPLYAIAMAIAGLTPKEFKRMYKHKDDKQSALNGRSIRDLMIFASEECGKKWGGQQYFGSQLVRTISERDGEGNLYAISDGGFQAELDALKEAFGHISILIIRLHRPGCSFEGDSRQFLSDPDVTTIDVQSLDVGPTSEEILTKVQNWSDYVDAVNN